MGEYKFYQDRKVTSWERDYFSVKANSYEEAEAIHRNLCSPRKTTATRQ